jgi:1-acyl-sn-glycerol-3-phosphate acyltransferase
MSTAPIHLPNPRLYALARAVVRALLWLLTRTEIRGQENIPPLGPYIILTNHLSTIDPPLIMAVFPSPVTVFAGHTHRHEFIIGEVMNALGAIWVKRGEVDRHALRAALDALKAGGLLGLAPEGTRSRTGGLLKGKIGAAYLATRADAPLVPVALTGTEIGLPALLKLGRPRITVTIGPPFRLPNPNPQAGRQELEVHTDLIMRTLAEMLPDKYRGVYRDSV